MTRTAIVTGAGRGIGAATVGLLRERGWLAIGIDRDWPDGHPDEDRITLDLRDHDALVREISSIEGLDALISNAAVMTETTLEDLNAEEISATMDMNLRAAMLGAAAATPALELTSGAIVNVASVHGIASRGGLAAYAASKGALLAFTRAAAVELGPRGIRVNAVVPGAVDTSMLAPSLGAEARTAAIEGLGMRTPLRRVAAAREIAEAMVFLADGERSSFVSGHSLVVDGGALAQLPTE